MTETESETPPVPEPAPETPSEKPDPKGMYRNPFIVALWGPAYLMVGTVAITNDFLMGAMFIMCTLALLGAYVTEFPLLPGLYQNEVIHKTAVSSLAGIGVGLVLFLASRAFVAKQATDGSPISPAGKFALTWGVMSIPAYLLMLYLVTQLNKRDLEEEDRIRKEKKKKRKGGGPPIMDRKKGF